MPFSQPWWPGLDRWAVALLAAGCAAGLSVLILRPPAPVAAPPSRSELQQRVHELEQRLLETVPASLEQRYRDL